MEYKNEYPGVIHFEKKEHVAILTFDNPKTLNALSYDIFTSINEIFDARHYTAQEALRLGYLSQVVEPEELMPTCEAFMARMLKASPLSLKYGKLMCGRCAEMSLQSSLEFERLIIGTLGTSEDWKEGIAAFQERRTPEFNNR